MKNFSQIVWAHYKEYGRSLPWRKTSNPYRILVSEIMLQQTQVDRVVPFYKNFIKKFPSPKKLAQAPLSEVLKSWQGLGYNRRAKMLHSAAKAILLQGMPRSSKELERLPGVGPYTARAVAAFAYNHDEVIIETNIRTVITHHFFSQAKKVSDSEIAGILKRILPQGKSRDWYNALMDYGAFLKSEGFRYNAKQQLYKKQQKFSGSKREVRGVLIRQLTSRAQRTKNLFALFSSTRRAQVQKALNELEREGLVSRSGQTYSLSK